MKINKLFNSVNDVMSDVFDGAVIMLGGFGEAGSPVELIHGLIDTKCKDLTIIANNAGNGRIGLGALIGENQVKKVICSFARSPKSITFKELYENNVSTFSFSFQGASSLSGDDVKLSERLYIPGRKLRGFESGKIGPKDGSDYIGGNYISVLNATTTVPKILENVQSVDIVMFADAANIWGVDYNSSLDKSGIRSSIGIGLDWLTPVGPLTFSLAQPITIEPTDTEESFRFNIGTSF